MLKPERYDKIVQIVNQNGSATVEELAAVLEVSRATIRRDLVQLGENKVLHRTYGGAIKYDKTLAKEVPIHLRVHMQKEEKERVATEAARLITEGSTIFIGAGTTGHALASKLDSFHHLTVVTNDIDVAKAVSCTDNGLLVVGGQLKKSSSTLYGFFAEEVLQQLRVDTAFMTADAIDPEKGFRDFDIDEITIKRYVLQIAEHTVMMCDISKFEKPAFVNICSFSDVYAMVTNENVDLHIIDMLRETGLRVILAKDKKQTDIE